jgi:hypothetical protein
VNKERNDWITKMNEIKRAADNDRRSETLNECRKNEEQVARAKNGSVKEYMGTEGQLKERNVL